MTNYYKFSSLEEHPFYYFTVLYVGHPVKAGLAGFPLLKYHKAKTKVLAGLCSFLETGDESTSKLIQAVGWTESLVV